MTISSFKSCKKVNNILDIVYSEPLLRYPVDIDFLAKEIHSLFQWNDAITQIQGAGIEGFEGALFKNNSNSWTLLFNSKIDSKQRIRFTKAHEIGHYVLHRLKQDNFQCSKRDINNHEVKNIEYEANEFASNILMPIHDFKGYIVNEPFSFELVKDLVAKYDVSLEALLIKWIHNTEESMILINSIDGFMKWAISSKQAMKSGAYFRTRKQIIEIPLGSLCSNSIIPNCLNGVMTPLRIWFPNTSTGLSCLEFKLFHEQYGRTLTVLLLPKGFEAWKD